MVAPGIGRPFDAIPWVETQAITRAIAEAEAETELTIIRSTATACQRTILSGPVDEKVGRETRRKHQSSLHNRKPILARHPMAHTNPHIVRASEDNLISLYMNFH
ncbi:hypothetical protein N7519_000239 [Penicillium mononematosum]|uniref:uncharacterized protein n=1 Tax=Penicillium mononematosum TaxID=268346 RepID=UPI0025473E68|nr:uncharacterized protein N7519_000239 [Penicillium mononematosum]KAJ6190218.1 hypothetical protein N7519_000239 [Penicillium mononematosum]